VIVVVLREGPVIGIVLNAVTVAAVSGLVCRANTPDGFLPLPRLNQPTSASSPAANLVWSSSGDGNRWP
jgi:hypothetical protein